MPLNPKTKFYTSPKAPIAVQIAFGLSILLLLATLVVVYCSWGGKLGIVPLYIFIGIWAVAPPVWFWFEYFSVYRKHGEVDTLELFKYGQDLSKAIWAGVLAGLIAFAASDAVKPSTNVAIERSSRVTADRSAAARPSE
jgi:hypothetical protein